MAARQTYTVAINTETKGAIRGLNNLNTALKGVIGLFAAKEVIDFGKNIIAASREIENLNNRLRIITSTQKQFGDTQAQLVRLAQETRTSYAEVVDLFSKLRVSTESLGISSDRVATVTAKLSKALVVAGADGNTASAVIRQFGQAMASGEVRGDEFRSIVEGLGPALAIMARESGLTVGELRKLSKEGKLTADVMFELFENSESLNGAFGSMEATISSAETAFADSRKAFMAHLGAITGISDAYKEALVDITRFLDKASGREGSIALIADEDLIGEVGPEAALKELESRFNKIAEFRKKVLEGGFTGDLITGGKLVSPEKQIEVAKGNLLGLGRKDEVDEIIALMDEAEQAIHDMAVATQFAEFRNMEYKHGVEPIIKAEKERAAKIKKVTDGLKDQIKAAEGFTLTDTRTELEKLLDRQKELKELSAELTAGLVNLSLVHGKESEEYKKLEELIAKVNTERETLIDLIEDEKQAIKDKEAEALKARLAEIKHYDDAILRIKKIQQADAESHFHNMVAKKKEEEEAEENAKKEQERKKQEIKDAIELNRKNFEVIGQHSKEAFELSKAIAIAQAIMGAHEAAIGAFSATARIPFVGPALAPVAAAASLAATMAQVATIRSQQFPGRAGGGPVQKGQPFMVGEGGRSEMFIPSQNGTIVNQSQMGGMGAVNVTFNIDATDADGFDTLLVQRKNTIVSMVRQAVQQGRLA